MSIPIALLVLLRLDTCGGDIKQTVGAVVTDYLVLRTHGTAYLVARVAKVEAGQGLGPMGVRGIARGVDLSQRLCPIAVRVI